jgi:hypothetical protein
MRAAAVLRSGGRPFFYPKTVWSPAGGWHADPANWRGAAATAAAAIAAGQTQLRGGRRAGVKQPRVCACVVAPRVACGAACRGRQREHLAYFYVKTTTRPDTLIFLRQLLPPLPLQAHFACPWFRPPMRCAAVGCGRARPAAPRARARATFSPSSPSLSSLSGDQCRLSASRQVSSGARTPRKTTPR